VDKVFEKLLMNLENSNFELTEKRYAYTSFYNNYATIRAYDVAVPLVIKVEVLFLKVYDHFINYG